MDQLEQLLGSEKANELVARFDPSTTLSPRPYVETKSITSSRDRALTHELIDRVWGGQLNHETGRKSLSMFIWVPGSRIPRWLESVHKARKQHQSQKSTKPTSLKPSGPAKLQTAPAYKRGPSAATDLNNVWHGFAGEAHARYMDIATKSGKQYAEEQKALKAKSEYIKS